MAFYISIMKVSEDAASACYRFVGDRDRAGSFTIAKETGEVKLVEEMPGDAAGHMFNRAAIKILRAWKTGMLPESAEWAS